VAREFPPEKGLKKRMSEPSVLRNHRAKQIQSAQKYCASMVHFSQERKPCAEKDKNMACPKIKISHWHGICSSL
jgi:hypothetical protein